MGRSSGGVGGVKSHIYDQYFPGHNAFFYLLITTEWSQQHHLLETDLLIKRNDKVQVQAQASFSLSSISHPS